MRQISAERDDAQPCKIQQIGRNARESLKCERNFLVLRHGFVCERAAGQAERAGGHRSSLRNNHQNSRLLEYQGGTQIIADVINDRGDRGDE